MSEITINDGMRRVRDEGLVIPLIGVGLFVADPLPPEPAPPE